MPRANSVTLMCGAMGTPAAFFTTPGLSVCSVHSPASKVVAVRPKQLKGFSRSKALS
ncbi:hypothetical protein D3C84_1038420 [compost metagenome]